ncbi:MAG: dipeptidase PepE [Bacteroidetes bacterium]|nr:dipeptidase PepE [Bacteroidota bacterium]
MPDLHLLLISNSTNAGEEYLAWPRVYIQEFIQEYGIAEILFVPYAGVNLAPGSIEKSFDLYTEKVSGFFGGLGMSVNSIHLEADPVAAVKKAGAIVVGGGNTFHLVKMMHETGIMEAVREKVISGTPYIGWSAGANVACPSMKTTNDMPISEPRYFSCLGLVPFQINPHYLDANPAGHGGETREQRILEFLAVNHDMTVAGLREGTLLHLKGDTIQLKGSRPMRVFRFGEEPKEIMPGDDVGFLLSSGI